jgi:hypothetical protein
MWANLVPDFPNSANYVPETRKLERADEMDAVMGNSSDSSLFAGSTSSYIGD